ncbi:MAG: HXXEE domain-containing protein [Terracidiphilus sp.]
MMNRLIVSWVYGGFLAGLLLLALTPVFVRGWAPALVATYLCLPAYMVHQYEEHDKDRFREFLNRSLKGKGYLSPLAVFIINVPGVWGVVAVSLWLAVRVNVGFGLIAAYLLLVNGAVHFIHGLIFRKYNPGLITALVIFVPLGAWCMAAIQQAGGGTAWMHAAGALVAVGIHVAIIVHVFRAGKGRAS